ncbi:unnamed protein product [Gulo gulo]|uniref:Uncharacterized protein n=1 Tax=Gulo gulo TaxID=48420 RepID=A0A9X9LNK6_GULGU|nr:unnamed protein product [Gulo gulo]
MTHNTRKRREAEASRHGGVKRRSSLRFPIPAPSAEASHFGDEPGPGARASVCSGRSPAPPVGRPRPLALFLLCGALTGAARAARAPLRRHRPGGGRTAATSGPPEGSGPRSHGLAYAVAHLCPTRAGSLARPPPPRGAPPLNGRTSRCASGPYSTRSHGAPGLEVWSQEGLLPATLWLRSSEKRGPLRPEKLEIQTCVSAPNSKRTQLTHILQEHSGVT